VSILQLPDTSLFSQTSFLYAQYTLNLNSLCSLYEFGSCVCVCEVISASSPDPVIFRIQHVSSLLKEDQETVTKKRKKTCKSFLLCRNISKSAFLCAFTQPAPFCPLYILIQYTNLCIYCSIIRYIVYSLSCSISQQLEIKSNREERNQEANLTFLTHKLHTLAFLSSIYTLAHI